MTRKPATAAMAHRGIFVVVLRHLYGDTAGSFHGDFLHRRLPPANKRIICFCDEVVMRGLFGVLIRLHATRLLVGLKRFILRFRH